MDRIVSAAWATGDPGLVFIDRANRSTANPTPEIEPAGSNQSLRRWRDAAATEAGLRADGCASMPPVRR